VKDDFGELIHLIDGSDASQSNWLRYVNCARTVEEQNIRPVQYENNIYYMATRDISPKQELLTYYGQKYAKKLGLEVPNKDKSRKSHHGRIFRFFSEGLQKKLGVVVE
jgi:hypothetical protein